MKPSPSTIRCDFCGLEFEPSCTEAGCQGCPLAQGCSRIICPRCGYEMLPEARLIGWVRQLKARWLAGRPSPFRSASRQEISHEDQ